MSVRTVGRAKHGRHRGRRTATKHRGRQRLGRVSGVLMACGAAYTALFLAPSYAPPLLAMAFFVLIGGFVMDAAAGAGALWVRLLGPGLALAGLCLVTWMMVAGGL